VTQTGRGPYLTESRTLALEQKIAATEERINQRLDQLEQRVAERVTVDVMRALTQGIVNELRGMLEHTTTTRNGGR
jgi:hypothetical protein